MAKKKRLTKAERREARLRKGKQWLIIYLEGTFFVRELSENVNSTSLSDKKQKVVKE